MILIDALYINNSGGKVLLDYLIEQCHASGQEFFYLLDSRVKGDYSFLPQNHVIYLQSDFLSRYQFYKRNELNLRAVFCFGNLPPNGRLNVPVYTYVHNMLYMQGATGVKGFFYFLKSMVLRSLLSHSDEWWVQTEVVKKNFCSRFKMDEVKVKVYPFYRQYPSDLTSIRREKNSFLYVSDANAHKNHDRLLEAFKIVQATHPQAKLYLTVSDIYPEQLHDLKKYPGVINLGKLDQSMLGREYAMRSCLIYPSLTESFGLGLLEAAQMKMPILGAELPYTYAVVNPTMTFNPYESKDMARVMLRFLNEGGDSAVLRIENKMPLILERFKSIVGDSL